MNITPVLAILHKTSHRPPPVLGPSQLLRHTGCGRWAPHWGRARSPILEPDHDNAFLIPSVLVLGATGAVGKHILSGLLASPEYTRVGEFGRRVRWLGCRPNCVSMVILWCRTKASSVIGIRLDLEQPRQQPEVQRRS